MQDVRLRMQDNEYANSNPKLTQVLERERDRERERERERES
jgi:hypothetical protein